MISNELQKKIKNKYITPYLLLLQNGLYLIIYDKDDDIIGRFTKNADGKIIEIHNVLFSDNIEEYLDEESINAHSILFRNIRNYELNKYVICERKEYIKRCKDFIKKIIDRVNEIKKPNTYTLICDSIERDAGKYVKFGENERDKGILVAACDSDEDLYWVIINNNMKIMMESAVGTYTIIEDKKELKGMNKELKRLQEEEPDKLLKMVTDFFENEVDYIFTNIKIK